MARAALPDPRTPRPPLPLSPAAAPLLCAAHSGQVDHFKAMSRAEQQEVERMYQNPCFKVGVGVWRAGWRGSGKLAVEGEGRTCHQAD